MHCKISLILRWSKNCVLTDITKTDAQGNNPAIAAPKGATFKMTDTELYFPVVTLSTQDDNKLLEQLKTGFKRTIKWKKYRSEITIQAKTENLNYLHDPAFSKVNRFIVLSFANEEDRTSFSKYYTAADEIKDFNVVVNGKSFFDVPVKNKEETYEKIIEMSKNNYYKTGNLLDYEYFAKHYKLISIDLSKQIDLEGPDLKQEISFIGNLERDKGAAMYFVIEKTEETTFNSVTKINLINQNPLSIILNGNKKDHKFVK